MLSYTPNTLPVKQILNICVIVRHNEIQNFATGVNFLEFVEFL